MALPKFLSFKLQKLNLYQAILTSVLVYGIVIRIQEYLRNRSLWLDEASLALDVVGKTYFELITTPLDYSTAPIGFLLLIKFCISIFHNNEFTLRFVSLISGITSIFIFYKLLNKTVRRKSALIALILLSTSTILLRYSTEFKQYSSDLLVALLIQMYGLFLLNHKLDVKQAFNLGILGGGAVLFSFPAVFTVGSLMFVLFYMYAMNRRWIEVRNLLVSLLISGSILILNYVLFLTRFTNNSSLSDFWSYDFMPLPLLSGFNLQWLFFKFKQIFEFPGGFAHPLIAAVLFIIGCQSMFHKNKLIFLMLILPIILCLGVSSLHKYPFNGRHLLFYVPFLYLFVAEGISFLMTKSSSLAKFFGYFALFIIIFLSMINVGLQSLNLIIYAEEIKPVLNHIKLNKQKNDTVYIYYSAQNAFNYYKEKFGFDTKVCIYGIDSRNDWEKYHKDLDQLRNKDRTWIIFSHVYKIENKSEETYFTSYLDTIGQRIDYVTDVNASAYLYKFKIDGE